MTQPVAYTAWIKAVPLSSISNAIVVAWHLVAADGSFKRTHVTPFRYLKGSVQRAIVEQANPMALLVPVASPPDYVSDVTGFWKAFPGGEHWLADWKSRGFISSSKPGPKHPEEWRTLTATFEERRLIVSGRGPTLRGDRHALDKLRKAIKAESMPKTDDE
jgi:hypothetical protein